MSQDDKPPELSPDLAELLAEATDYLKRRAPAVSPRHLLERNTVELLGAYVQAEREASALVMNRLRDACRS